MDSSIKQPLINAFWRSKTEGVPIEASLNLRRRGYRDPETKDLLKRRDVLLQKLAAERQGSAWEKACFVADEIAAYPRGKHKKLFAYMIDENMPLPRSVQRIYQIIRRYN